jgi:hypothetical protein
MGLIHYWTAGAFQRTSNTFVESFNNSYPLKDEVIAKILLLRETHPAGKSFDQNLLCLVMANRSFNRGDSLEGLKYYRQFNRLNFGASMDKYEYLEKTFFLNQLNYLCINLALINREKEAVELTEQFDKDNEKALTYILMSGKIYIKKADPTAFVYLDSAFSKSKRVDYSQLLFGQGVGYRFSLIRVLSLIGGKRLNELSAEILAGVMNDDKPIAIYNRVDGIAEEGNFYRAKESIPSTLTEFDDLMARTIIMWNACKKKESAEEKKKWVAFDRILEFDNYIPYLNN